MVKLLTRWNILYKQGKSINRYLECIFGVQFCMGFDSSITAALGYFRWTRLWKLAGNSNYSEQGSSKAGPAQGIVVETGLLRGPRQRCEFLNDHQDDPCWKLVRHVHAAKHLMCKSISLCLALFSFHFSSYFSHQKAFKCTVCGSRFEGSFKRWWNIWCIRLRYHSSAQCSETIQMYIVWK